MAELKNSADSLLWTSESQIEEHKSKIDEETKNLITEKN